MHRDRVEHTPGILFASSTLDRISMRTNGHVRGVCRYCVGDNAYLFRVSATINVERSCECVRVFVDRCMRNLCLTQIKIVTFFVFIFSQFVEKGVRPGDKKTAQMENDRHSRNGHGLGYGEEENKYKKNKANRGIGRTRRGKGSLLIK